MITEKLKKKFLRSYFLYPAILDHCKRCKSESIPEVNLFQKQIPKIIHYCWFGRSPDTELKIKCMESWTKYCPDYELRLWNEDSFCMDEYPFARQALEDKKWAYVSDVARLHSLYYEGGIYMDTDVEVFQPIGRFLEEDFFSGYESKRKIPTAIMGSKAGNSYLGKLLLWYIGKNYHQGFYDVPNVKIISKFTERFYNVTLGGEEFSVEDDGDKAHFYPETYFCRPMKGSTEAYSKHHFTGSWKE